MFDRLRTHVLRFMRVPPAPEPPAGAPESVRIFRAGRNFYRLRLLAWGTTQVGAVIGLIISIGFFTWFRHEVLLVQREVLTATAEPPPVVRPVAPAPSAAGTANPAAKPRKRAPDPKIQRDLRRLAQRTPGWVIIVIEVIEVGGVLLFLLQLPVTFAATRLEFELHWYIVTDRSLRIRTGLLRLQESTMSFANLQQVEIQQGPLQRLLGLADLRVQSAGGGAEHDPRQGRDSLHTGVFHGVENAAEIRDLILDRLRKFRETGLGDPDDHGQHPVTLAPPPADTLAAAAELLAEARNLRRALAAS